MSCIVMKFGGTSVADLERIRAAARRVKGEVEAGHSVTVLVSAMAGVTDQLVETVAQTAGPGDGTPDPQEYDAVVSSGEQVTSGLMALVLQQMGVKARSWQGWQLPMRTDKTHGSARIEEIDTTELRRGLETGVVAVIAGFQGLSPEGRITTLGRGGTDTSAVALAAALEADRCDIYTDVEGVFTADPRIVAKARKMDRITYEEMLEMASQGAKVLQTRSVEMAMKRGVPLRVLSAFEDKPGTDIVDEDEIVEQAIVSGIAYSRDEAKITILDIADQPGVAAQIFGPLSEAAVNVDMIVQSASSTTLRTDMTFTVGVSDLQRAVALLQSLKEQIGYRDLQFDNNVAKVSVIGVGMRSHAGVAQSMFKALADRGINIQVISTSEIKVSVLIAEEYTELALRSLHTAYGLDDL